MNDKAEINAIKDFFALSYFEYYPNATQEQFEKEFTKFYVHIYRVAMDYCKSLFYDRSSRSSITELG